MSEEIALILGENTQTAIQGLNKFVNTQAKTFSFPELGNNRADLWTKLYEIAVSTEDQTVLKNCFIALRILSRDKTALKDLFTDDWFSLTLKHSGLDDPNFTTNLETAIEVLKCLCNLIFNCRSIADKCCKHGVLKNLIQHQEKHQSERLPYDIIFFNVKITFLLTALCPSTRLQARTEMGGDKSMIGLLQTVLSDLKTTETIILSDENVDYVCEIFKALFNITIKNYGKADEEEVCNQLMSVLRLYILIPTASKEKKTLLMTNIIHLINNMPGKSYKSLTTPIEPNQALSDKLRFETHNMTVFYEILRCLEEKFSDDIEVSKQRELLSPIIIVLLTGATSERCVRKYLRAQILPPLVDVHRRPEQGYALRNHLCRLLTSPMVQLRDMISNLLFVLCKMNINRMIKYTGYGNAAGLFAQRGLLGGQADDGAADFSEDEGSSDTEEYTRFKHGINPVTGCYETPRANPMDDMSEEQKEYEAMKLVQLMHELTQCGTIRPCTVGADGRPQPIEHVLELQNAMAAERNHSDSE